MTACTIRPGDRLTAAYVDKTPLHEGITYTVTRVIDIHSNGSAFVKLEGVKGRFGVYRFKRRQSL